MRRILMLSLAMIFTFDVSAAPGTAQSEGLILEFVKKTKLNQKSRSFEDLVRNTQTELPSADYKILKDISARVPDLMIPKVDINRVKNDKGGEDLQIQMVDQGQSATISVAQDGDDAVVKVVTSAGKQEKVMRFSTSLGPAQMQQQILALINEVGPRHPTDQIQMLSLEDVKTLTMSEKKKYFQKLQDLMEAAEKVQALSRSPATTTSFWNLLINSSYAANTTPAIDQPPAPPRRPVNPNDGPGEPVVVEAPSSGGGSAGSCIVAGYSSEMRDGVCGKGDSRIPSRSGGSEVRCNTSIYGENAKWVSATAAPGQCSRLHSGKNDFFPGTIRNDDEFRAAHGSAFESLEQARRTCEGLKKNGKPSQGQVAACADLRARYDSLRTLNCGALKKNNPQRFPDLDCRSRGSNDSIYVPPAPVVQVPPGQCENQGYPSERLECPPEMRVQVSQCPERFRCNCPESADDDIHSHNGIYPNRCSGSTLKLGSRSDSVRRGGGASAKFDWSKAMWAVGGGILGFLLAWLLLPRKTKTVTNTVTVPGPTQYVPTPYPVEVPVPVPVPVPIPGNPYTPPVR